MRLVDADDLIKYFQETMAEIPCPDKDNREYAAYMLFTNTVNDICDIMDKSANSDLLNYIVNYYSTSIVHRLELSKKSADDKITNNLTGEEYNYYAGKIDGLNEAITWLEKVENQHKSPVEDTKFATKHRERLQSLMVAEIDKKIDTVQNWIDKNIGKYTVVWEWATKDTIIMTDRDGYFKNNEDYTKCKCLKISYNDILNDINMSHCIDDLRNDLEDDIELD